MNRIIIAAALLFTGIGQAAFAQDGAGGPGGGQGRGGAVRAACAADMQKFCPNAQDRDSRRQCLADNKAQLSADCAAAVAARGERGQR